MKKLLTSVCAFLCTFSLASCSNPMSASVKRPNNLSNSFTAKMNISLDKLNAEGTVTRHGDNMWTAEFNSPNTLSGVTLNFEENIVKASYKGLDFSVPKSALPVKAMLSNLIEAVDTAANSEELTGTENEGLLLIEGSLDGGDYVISVDSNGNLCRFEMPNNLLDISFSEISASAPLTTTVEFITTSCDTAVTATTTTTSAITTVVE